MKIAAGSDHAGFDLKNRLCRFLTGHGHSVEDLGTYSPESTDYPDWAAAVGRAVAEGRADFGVLVCGTGVGMAMAANKVHGVRAANCNNLFVAGLARAHNDANIVTLGAREVGPEHAEAIVMTFLETAFEDGRHARRIAKIAALES